MSDMDRKQLERYLAGTASAEENARVEAWLAEDPERWKEITAARSALADSELSEDTVEAAMGEVWARLAPEVGPVGELRPRAGRTSPRARRNFSIPDQRRRKMVLGQLAAALLVLTVGGWLIITLVHRSKAAPGEVMRVVTTAPAERATFRLADGTLVMLGVASSLRYLPRFAESQREVVLEGEAYFDVAHEVDRPFVVRAGNLVAKDLGTQFTVRAYPEDASARVVVRQGRVAIRAVGDGGEEVVAPGQLGRLTATLIPTVEQADTSALFAWTEGRLVFEGTPLRQALPQLGRWFDLEFRLADSTLGEVPLSATLKSRPTSDALDNLAASLGMKRRQQGRVVMFYSAEPDR
jgi:transmembrane sensor